jgi:hypothetical protein
MSKEILVYLIAGAAVGVVIGLIIGKLPVAIGLGAGLALLFGLRRRPQER